MIELGKLAYAVPVPPPEDAAVNLTPATFALAPMPVQLVLPTETIV